MKLALALLMLSQFKPQPFTSSSVTPSSTPNIVQATTAALSLFVDPTGNDANACTGTGTAACLTIQAALNKVPKLLRHGVTIAVAAGSYTGFHVSGFTCDPGVQTTTGGLSVDGLGAMTNSTLASGSATGTFTSSTAGSVVTFGTGTDTGATWTVNDLKGRFIVSAGQTRVISSNTATVITIVGTWTSPGAVAYAIQDPGVIINTAIPAPATPAAAAIGLSYAIAVNNNQCGARNTSFVIRGMRLANTLGPGIGYNDPSATQFSVLQVRNTSGGNRGFFSGQPTAGQSGNSTGGFFLNDIDFLGNGTNPTIEIGSGAPVIQRVLVRSPLIGLRVGLNALANTGAAAQAAITGFETQAATGASIVVTQGTVTLTSGRLDCSASGGTAIVVGGQSASAASTAGPASFATLVSANVTTCGTGLALSGPLAAADVTALTGAAATTGFMAYTGGLVAFAKAGVTLTAGTNEIDLDAATATSTFAGITAGQCLSTSQGSRACAR